MSKKVKKTIITKEEAAGAVGKAVLEGAVSNYIFENKSLADKPNVYPPKHGGAGEEAVITLPEDVTKLFPMQGSENCHCRWKIRYELVRKESFVFDWLNPDTVICRPPAVTGPCSDPLPEIGCQGFTYESDTVYEMRWEIYLEYCGRESLLDEGSQRIVIR
tara:strand:- start:157 stop:639 length:483 start_codon:yes stop_codon:yes gene_type:complete